MNTINRIIEFLSVPPELIEKADPDLLAKMIKAVKNDDYFTLHHLGYNIKKEV